MKSSAIPKAPAKLQIAVIDSGWDRALVDPRVLRGVGLVHPSDEFALHYSDDDRDRIGHGTACSRIILGLASNVSIVPVRIFGRRLEASVEQLVAALHWALEQGVQLINLSLATLRDDALVPLYGICEEATHRGTIIVAAAFPPGERGYPAVFDNAIGVRAGRVPSPNAFRYRSDAPVECIAFGRPPGSAPKVTGRARWGTNSLAAARVTALIAQFRRRVPNAGLAETRAWLSRTAAVNPL